MSETLELELEFKYRADDVKLTDFINLMQTLKITERLDTSSWDYYYWSGVDEDEFLRYRESDNPELTIKKKIKNTNNWRRIELDLPLDKDLISVDLVNKWCNALGYDSNFKIYKSCFIFWTDDVNYVYYIVYNDNMKEIGRFMEVELNKDRVKDLGEKAQDVLKEAESNYQILGVTSQNRMKKSLWELFRKVEVKENK